MSFMLRTTVVFVLVACITLYRDVECGSLCTATVLELYILLYVLLKVVFLFPQCLVGSDGRDEIILSCWSLSGEGEIVSLRICCLTLLITLLLDMSCCLQISLGSILI